MKINAAEALGSARKGLLRELARCCSAAVAPLMALMLVPISGAIALGIEVSSWQYMQRSMQNAADTAAIAAATYASSDSSSATLIQNEARAAAKPYGFVDGTNGTTVSAAVATCPTGTPTGAFCYRATISTSFPLFFSRVVGFAGSSANSQSIIASALATTRGGNTSVQTPYCIRTLKESLSVEFNVNGGSKVDLGGCSIVSDAGMNCNGQPLDNAGYAIMATGTWSPQHYCSSPAAKNVDSTSQGFTGVPDDPYNTAAYKNNIPSDPCKGKYPGSLMTTTPTSNVVSVCGNLTVGTKVNNGNSNNCATLTASKCEKLTITKADTTIVVYNGKLDLNGNALLTSGSGTVTIILAGSSTLDADNGVLDIKAPGTESTSVWKGIAIYQTPPTPAPVAAAIAGSNSIINVRGVFYLPRTDLTVSGAVNKNVAGSTCFLMVTDTLLINGGGRIVDRSGCADAGVADQTVTVGGGATVRERLVQ